MDTIAILADDLAAQLGVTRNTLADWRARHYGPPAHQVGARIIYHAAEVDEWLRNQPSPSQAQRGGRRFGSNPAESPQP